MSEQTKNRGSWSSQFGFILAATGSAVGLGNIWKFPYITGENGGGLFVLIYLVSVAAVGIPIMIAEVLLGRAAQSSPVGSFKTLAGENSKWKIIGWIGIIAGFIILSYYSVVAGWCLHYVFVSLSGAFEGKTVAEIGTMFGTLYKSPGTNIFWHLVFIGMTISVVVSGVQKGIEAACRVLMPILLLILIFLFFYAVTLPGFTPAFKYLFYPDIAKLKVSGVLEALGHAFFTLSLGMGAMLTYGSYMKKTQDIPKASFFVSIADTAIALLACLVLFPITFTFAGGPGKGVGLVFQTMPIAFSKMLGGKILAILFFLLLVFAALSSSISLLEVVASYFIDEHAWSRKKAVYLSGAAIFIFGVPSALAGSGVLFGDWVNMFGKNFFDLMDFLASNWLLPLGGFFIALYVGWFLEPQVRKTEFVTGSSWGKLFTTWLLLIKYIAPVAVVVVFLQNVGFIDLNTLLGSREWRTEVALTQFNNEMTDIQGRIKKIAAYPEFKDKAQKLRETLKGITKEIATLKKKLQQLREQKKQRIRLHTIKQEELPALHSSILSASKELKELLQSLPPSQEIKNPDRRKVIKTLKDSLLRLNAYIQKARKACLLLKTDKSLTPSSTKPATQPAHP